MRPTTFLFTFLLAQFANAQIGSGNLVVLRVGDGISPLSNASQAMFLDEYTTSGTLVQTIALPTAVAGTNLPITCSGTATSEGNLQISENGQYFVFTGYNAAPGVPAIASTSSAVNPRVVGLVDLNGGIDTSTSTISFTGNNIRSATSTNGIDIFAVGANSGVQYITRGASASIDLTGANVPQNNRTIGIYAGQLYVTGSAQGFYGVSAVGSGVPTTPVQIITALPGMPTASGPSHYDFFFADPNTLYVADDRNTGGNGGIHKYTQSGGTWTLQYILNPSATQGCRSITGVNNGGVVTLFATNTTTSANEIVMVTDTGATSTFTTVATAASGTVLRGIRIAPGLNTITRLPHGCGSANITVTGNGAIGSTVAMSLINFTGLPFFGFGFTVIGAPFCPACTLGHEWAVATFGNTSNLVIPNDSSFIGLVIAVQGADLFANGGCTSPQVTLSDTLVVTIH